MATLLLPYVLSTDVGTLCPIAFEVVQYNEVLLNLFDTILSYKFSRNVNKNVHYINIDYFNNQCFSNLLMIALISNTSC